jgi:hypothetical protein
LKASQGFGLFLAAKNEAEKTMVPTLAGEDSAAPVANDIKPGVVAL